MNIWYIISAGRRWPNIFSRTGNSIEVKRSRWETNLNIDTHALLQKGKWDGKSLKISHRQSWSKLHKKWRGCTTAATTITNSIQWQISSKPNLPFFDKTLLVLATSSWWWSLTAIMQGFRGGSNLSRLFTTHTILILALTIFLYIPLQYWYPRSL